MRTIVKGKVDILLTKIEVLNKRLDDKIVKGIASPNEVRDIIAETIKLTNQVKNYISVE